MEIIFIGANNPETIRMIKAVEGAVPNFRVAGFLDNAPEKKGTSFFGFPVLGGFESLHSIIGRNDDVRFVNLITRDCVTRYETSLEVARAGGHFANFIHPGVNLQMVAMGEGNYIQENVVIQAGVGIGNNSSIHIGSLIGHETKIGNSVFIAHGCNLSGLVTVEDGVFMGTGVSVVPRVKIGRWSIVGAGSVITKDVPPYSVVVGSPGRVIRAVEHKYENGDV